jgi:hypothetical protein
MDKKRERHADRRLGENRRPASGGAMEREATIRLHARDLYLSAVRRSVFGAEGDDGGSVALGPIGAAIA